MTERVELPPGWAAARLGDIAEVRLGRQRSPKRATGPNMVPYLRAANVTWEGLDLSDVKEMDFTPSEQATYRLRDGDILLSEASGSASEVGKPAVYRGQPEVCCFQNTLIRVRADNRLVPFLHKHFLREALLGAFARSSRGVGIHHLGAQALDDWTVTLPASVEQQRIVEAIDSYFSRLDDAVATLERAQTKLKAYRASVLKAAVEGRLVPTEAELARAEKRDYEPADVLLKRILAERRRRWEEAELAKLKASGKTPKDDKWKARYVEPVGPAGGLPELPEGWSWATVDQLTDGARRLGYGVLVPGPDVDDGVPFIRVGDMADGTVSARAMKRIARDVADQFAKTYVRGGEVLISLVGTIGRTAVVPDHLAGANVARAVGVFPTADLVRGRWAEQWFRSPRVNVVMVSKAHEVARKTLNLEDVRTAHVALPPLAEQDRIVAAVEGLESVSASASDSVKRDLSRCARLRQAILKWAFEGKLVDQDPNDEPAEKLLERIRAEREAAAPAKATKKKPGRKPKKVPA